MPACVAYGCTNRSDKINLSAGISFLRFPSDSIAKTVWIRAIRRKNFVPTKYSRICSTHFKEEDFIGNVRRKLKKDAIPSIFPSFPKYLQNDHLNISHFKEADGQMRRSKLKAIATISDITNPPSRKNSPRPPQCDQETQIEPEIIPTIISQVFITQKVFNDLHKVVCNSLHDVTVILAPNIKLVIKKDMPDNGDTISEQLDVPDNDIPDNRDKFPEQSSGSLLDPKVIIKEEIVEIEETLKGDETCDLLYSSSTGAPSSEKAERPSCFTKHNSTNENVHMALTSDLLERKSSCSSDKIIDTCKFSKLNSLASSKKRDCASDFLELNSCGSSQETKIISSSSEQYEQAFSFLKKYPPSSPEQNKACCNEDLPIHPSQWKGFPIFQDKITLARLDKVV